MGRDEITDKNILQMEQAINISWADIQSIFETEEDQDRVVKLSAYLDDRNIQSLFNKYGQLPPEAIVYVNNFFQAGVREFLLKTIKKIQIEQFYGD